MRYTSLLFDLDHTLIDSDTSERLAFETALRACGVEDPLEHLPVYSEINLSLWHAVERGEIRPADVRVARFERFCQAIELDADAESMAETFCEGLGAHGDLYPGARRVLDALAERGTLALVTNGFSDVQRSRVERLGLERYFDAISISAELGAAKPGRAIFDMTFDELGSPPRETAVMIGDSMSSDMKGGAGYGIATCWYNPHGKPASPEVSIEHEIQSLEELLSVIEI